MNISKIFSSRYIVTFLLILMNIQYVYIEGWTVSFIKFGVMCLCPLIWLIKSGKTSTSMLWAGAYFLSVLFSGLFNAESFRASTVGYLFTFIAMFLTYFHLVYYEDSIDAGYFEKILKGLIKAYAICLILQQIVRIAGIDYMPLINLNRGDTRGVLVAQSLAIEQSYSAITMGACMLCLLRMYELRLGIENMTIKNVFNQSKSVVFCFLWAMLTMGSATAFVALPILMLYFVHKKYILYAIPVLIGLYFISSHIEYGPFARVRDIAEATATLDSDLIYETDMSASARILPYVYTLENFDIKSSKTWFGEGIDTGVENDIWGLKRMIGGMTDYGFLSYIFTLLFLFNCVIKRFFSLETLFFMILMMAEIRSTAVWWGVLMLFTTVRYFYLSSKEKI